MFQEISLRIPERADDFQPGTNFGSWAREFARRTLLETRRAVKTEARRTRLEATLPLGALGLAPRPGLRLRGDAGFISSDAEGTVNAARTYWSNPATNFTSDLPSEAWLEPAAWGDLVFE